MTENKRTLIDFYNNTDTDVLASSDYQSVTPIVEDASEYYGVVEYARVDMANMVLDPAPLYEILILNDEGGKIGNTTPAMPNFVNIFRFPGALSDVFQMQEWFYDVFHKKALPHSLGDINMTTDGYFQRKVTQQEYDESYVSGLFKVYFNTPLKELLPQFITTEVFYHEGKAYWGFNSSSTNNQNELQRKDTLPQLLKAVSIRIYSTLPTTPYEVQNQAVNTLMKENILTTIALNPQTTDILNKTLKSYEPPVFRYFTMTSNSPISSYSVWLKIYYSTGQSVMHTLKPGEYYNLQLCWIPRN